MRGIPPPGEVRVDGSSHSVDAPRHGCQLAKILPPWSNPHAVH